MTVSKEPPDPDMDPRVEEILQEAEVQRTSSASKPTENYTIGEGYDYYDYDEVVMILLKTVTIIMITVMLRVTMTMLILTGAENDVTLM